MKIKINDNEISLQDGSSLSDALSAASIEPKGIATAVNGVVVSALARESTILHEGDTIIIIKAFYGG